MEFKHYSVLLEETIEHLNIRPDGIYVDGTLGGAGHAVKWQNGYRKRDVSSASIRMRMRSGQRESA